MVWSTILPAAVGAAGSLIGWNESEDAANDIERAQARAAAEDLALRREQWEHQRQLFHPYYSAGLQGLYGNTGVMALLGHSGGGASQPANAFSAYTDGTYGLQTPAEQNADRWAAYGAANPDVRSAYQEQNIANSPHLLTGGGRGADLDGNGAISPEEYYQWHYETMGKGEGRGFGDYGKVSETPTAPGNGAPNVVANGDGSYSQGGGSVGPISAESYGGSEPVGPITQALRQTPGHQFMMDESRRMLEGSAAARGELLSGGTMHALSDRALGLADQTYGANVDRQFQLANLGMGSAAQITNAGNNYASGSANAFYHQGQAAANGANNRNNAFQQIIPSIANGINAGIKGFF